MRVFDKNTPTSKSQRGISRIILIAGGVVLALLAVGAIVYGPDLVAYYRFDEAVTKFAREDDANGGKWPRVTDECAVCHGFRGNPAAQYYARLAGQPAVYVARRLNALATDERVNPIMGTLAKTMSPAEIAQLSAYFAAQKPERNAFFVADPAAASKGEALVKSANCVACHGPDLAGHDEFPRLAGQGYDYLVDQLSAFKSGQRRDPTGSMPAMTAALSETDIHDVAQYLAAR